MFKVKIGFVPSYRAEWGAMNAWCKKMRSDALDALVKVAGLELVYPRSCPDDPRRIDPILGYTPDGAVGNLDEGEALADYFQREKVDGIVICTLNFGDERSAAKIAEKLHLPVLLYATREPPAPESASMARISDSYCGTLSTASALYRRKIPFHYAGIFFHDEPAFLEEIETFVRAVSVVKGLIGARIGQVGVRPSNFETVGYDETAMILKFGQNVIYRDLSEVIFLAQDYSDDDPAVQAVVKSIRSEVAQVTVAEDWLSKAARLELALKEFWEKNQLSGLAMQCWPAIQRFLGIQVCAIYGRLTGQGMLTACETDILGTISMLVNYRAVLGETVPHFIDWTIQHRERPNWFLAWHCGNAPTCLADDPAKTALRSRLDMKGELPVHEGDIQAGLYQFQVKPGKVTFCRMAEYDNQWKMLITNGEIVPSQEVLAGTWAWVALKDHALLYRTLVEEGFIHHASMIHGDQSKALIQACKYLDIRPVVID